MEADNDNNMDDASSDDDDDDANSESKADNEIPNFAALTAHEMLDSGHQYHRIRVPAHRYTPLKQSWNDICDPIVKHMRLQIKFNPKQRCVELRTSPDTTMSGAMQKAHDFVRAFMLGFEIKDAIALLRLDNLYIDSFEIKDVKTLHGEHLARAKGRIAGQGGKTKFVIENATKTRIVLADNYIHVFGSFTNIKTAKSALVRLIMGSPPSKIFTQMRAVAARQKDKF
jgi:RNA-binding protein PNO1